jgi:hypothetical protein
MKSVQSVFIPVKSFIRSMFLPPMLFHSRCLASWCAQQCNKKCCTISSCCLQSVHVGESALLMRCRCLASGACPVRSCERMLASFLGSGVMRSTYLFDSVFASVFFILSYWHELFHIFCALFFTFSPYACIIADFLCGSLFLRSVGRALVSSLPSVMAFFACLSAFSFPSTPLCPGTHLTFILIPLCFFLYGFDAIMDCVEDVMTWVGFG